MCGQVVCGDCSRVRASLPQFREREVRICVECTCDLTAAHESLPLAPIYDFVHTQLRSSTFKPEKLELALRMREVESRMRETEQQLFEADDSVARPTQELSNIISGTGDANAATKANGSQRPASPPLATLPPVPATPPSSAQFIDQMKALAAQSQSLQHQLQELQIKDGLLVQVILQNINSSSSNQVWNDQASSSDASTPENSLNAGLYRYLLILPPPHRLVCMTALLFPPTPSVFKRAIKPRTASAAIQHQLQNLRLPPHLLDAPIEAAREFFHTLAGKDKDKGDREQSDDDTDETSASKEVTESSEPTVTQPHRPSDADAPPAVTLAELEADTTDDTAPESASAASSPVAPSADPVPSSQQGRMRFYAIRDLDCISSIRPLDFRSERGHGGVQRGFTINFHKHAAPTSAGLMDSITNRRDDDVLALYRQSWNCIIVDDQLKRVQAKFQQAIGEATKSHTKEVAEVRADIPAASRAEPEKARSVSPDASAQQGATGGDITPSTPVKPTATSTAGVDATAETTAKQGNGSSPSTPTPATTTPATPTASTSAPAAPASSSSSFFSSILSVFAPNSRQGSDSSRSKSPPPPSGPPPPPTAAQKAAAASAELGYRVQQEVISGIHACSVSYYKSLVEQEKQQVRTWMTDMKTPVSWEVDEHRLLLERLWATYAPVLAPSSPHGVSTSPGQMNAPPFPGQVAEEWKLLGFQGTNPCTDFRGVGLLSLKVLVYLGEVHPELVHVLMSLQSTKLMKPREYPLACAGINIVCAVVNLLELHAPAAASGMNAASQANNSIVPGSLARPEQGPATVLLNDINRTLTTVTTKLLLKEDAVAPVILTPHQEHMASLWTKITQNRLFRLFVRHKSRLARQKASSEDAHAHTDGDAPSTSPPAFDPATPADLAALHSMGELVATLFPILDDLWVEEDADYFAFNHILRSVMGALETALVKRTPRDLSALARDMKAHLAQERRERLRQEKLRAAMAQKQREATNKKHHVHPQTHSHRPHAIPHQPHRPHPTHSNHSTPTPTEAQPKTQEASPTVAAAPATATPEPTAPVTSSPTAVHSTSESANATDALSHTTATTPPATEAVESTPNKLADKAEAAQAPVAISSE